MTKAESKENRQAAQECNKIQDPTARENCHNKLAEKLTGLSSDPNQVYDKSNTNTSMIVNGVGTAYAALSFLNAFGNSKKSSPCTSKKIYGITSVGGLLSDFYIKYKTNKKVDELKEKYKTDTKVGAQEAQLRAFEYLKDEQNTIKEVSGMEKKRNMVLMVGYGAAAVMALYEMTPMGANAACTKPEPDCNKEPKAEGCPKKEEPKQTDCTKDPKAQGCPQSPPAENNNPPAENNTPPAKDDNPPVENNTSPVKNDTTPENIQPNNPTVSSAAESPKANIDATTKMVNGKETAYYKITDPTSGQRMDIVDNKLYPVGSKTPVGTLDYGSGQVKYFDSSKTGFEIGTVNNMSNTKMVPSGTFNQAQHCFMRGCR